MKILIYSNPIEVFITVNTLLNALGVYLIFDLLGAFIRGVKKRGGVT